MKNRTVKQKIKKAEKPYSRKKIEKALKLPLCERLMKEKNLIIGSDDLFKGGIAYAYCSPEEFCELYERFYGEKPKMKSAHGYCLHGEADTVRCYMDFVWVNSLEKKSEAIPTFAHEISHLADNIIKHAGVKDTEGEVYAYIVERETKRLLTEMYGITCTEGLSLDKIKEMLK